MNTRSIGMSPEDARKYKNYSKVFDRLYSKQQMDSRQSLHVGDKVGIIIHKILFENGTTAN